jgi:hypothetical protein
VTSQAASPDAVSNDTSSTGASSNDVAGPGISGRGFARSLGAVGVGTVVGILLTIGTDAIFHRLGVFPKQGEIPTTGALLLATVYRCVYGVVASYVIARMAARRPMMHALVGGMLGIVANAAGAIATWNAGPQYGAHWYPIALILTSLPCAWLGGKWYQAGAAKPDPSN